MTTTGVVRAAGPSGHGTSLEKRRPQRLATVAGGSAMTGQPSAVDLMTLTEAARYLRVDPDDLLRAATEDRVPSHSVSGEIVFVREELLDELSRPHPSFRD
jgi:hypothetical protein